MWVDELQLTLACDGDSLVLEVDVVSLNTYALACRGIQTGIHSYLEVREEHHRRH
jgi:hypothetical protein